MYTKYRLIFFLGLLLALLTACAPATAVPPTDAPTELPTLTAAPSATFTPLPPTRTPFPLPTDPPTPKPLVPNFAHIVILIFENKEYGTVIGNASMPNYNRYAQDYALLNAYYAVTHPSLPNYIAMMGGDTFRITSNCSGCFVDATSLPDLIEASGRTWRTYQERMPSPCYLGDAFKYVQKHNPFIYFTSIRENAARCQNGIVPLTRLDADMEANALPNFVFITPDLCNSAHDCSVATADAWLGDMVPKLQSHLDATGQPYWIILTWDEGQGNHSCCGLPSEAGGRVATVFISPQVKPGFQDETPYTHYSLLKTISASWHLPYLGQAADALNALIIAPWQ
jgi:phospholipase C